MSNPRRSVWDHARAALLVAHVAAVTVAAVPTPDGELSAANRRNPEVRASLAPWSALVVAAGLAADEDRAVRWLFARGEALVAARRVALAPVDLWLDLSGNGQSWRMFGVVPLRVGRLEIHGCGASGAWRPLYVERIEGRWGSLVLDQARVRALRSHFGLREYRARYDAFARWLGEAALRDHPELAAVRVRYVDTSIGAGRAAEPHPRWETEVRRP